MNKYNLDISLKPDAIVWVKRNESTNGAKTSKCKWCPPGTCTNLIRNDN